MVATSMQEAAPARFPVLRLAAVFGLASGLLEGVLYNIFQQTRWLSWDEAIGAVGPEQVWISAVVNLALFGFAGLAMSAAQRWMPWRHWPAVAVSVFGVLAFYDLIHLAGRMRKLGSLALAAGCALQTTRWLLREESRARRWARKLLPALAALTLLAAGGVYAGRLAMEKSREAQLPAASKEAPNILLVVMDAARADRLSGYGYARPTTPNLDEMARWGVLFERAYATSSWTLPSHASLMTGLLPFEHRATARGDWRALDGTHATLADYLRSKGYATAGFVANSLWAAPRTGLDHGFLRYVCLYTTPDDMLARTFYGRVVRRSLLPRLGLPTDRPRPMAPELNQSFLEWLDGHAERPFFAFLNYLEAHDGVVTVRAYEDRPGPKPALVAGSARPPSNQAEEYDYAMACMDAEIAKLLKELRNRGRLENTLVVITSDHGELLGEMNLTGHGNSLHHRLLQVPLILWNPRMVPEGARVAQPVSQTDLASTLLDLIGSAGHPLPGNSLRAAWSSGGNQAAPRPVLAEIDGAPFGTIPEEWPIRQGWIKSMIQEQWQLLLREDGEVQLYDVLRDPGQESNLAATDEGRAVAERLRARLEELIPEARAARRAAKGRP